MIYLVMLPSSLLLLLPLLCCSLYELHAPLAVSQLAFLLAYQPLELLYFKLAAEESALKIKQSHLLLSRGNAL